MSKNTKIEWCDSTFNPWLGCSPVSPACDHCYAERIARQYRMNCFGRNPRKITTDVNWKKPLAWNRNAERAGTRQSVFCGSMCDVFEARPELIRERERLWNLVELTPALDWLILTKRPENIHTMLRSRDWYLRMPHVHIGVTAENQKTLNERVRYGVAATDAALYLQGRVFLSMEPLLGSVDISHHAKSQTLDAVIVGGESGPNARPMHPDWVRALRDQCAAADVPFFFKQWGEYGSTRYLMADGNPPAFQCFDSHRQWVNKASSWLNKGDVCVDMTGTILYCGADFDRAKYPVAILTKIGKHKAGRLLDGREHNDVPWTTKIVNTG